jgi:hypothetical protein
VVGKLEENRPLGIPGCSWDYNTEMKVKET